MYRKPRHPEEESYVTLYRVQGGAGANASKKLLIAENQGLKLSDPKLGSVFIGDEETMRRFLRRRSKGYSSQDISEMNLEIIVFSIPSCVYRFIRENEVEQDFENARLRPTRADKTLPGVALELSGFWLKLLIASCINSECIRIKDKFNLTDMLDKGFELYGEKRPVFSDYKMYANLEVAAANCMNQGAAIRKFGKTTGNVQFEKALQKIRNFYSKKCVQKEEEER